MNWTEICSKCTTLQKLKVTEHTIEICDECLNNGFDIFAEYKPAEKKLRFYPYLRASGDTTSYNKDGKREQFYDASPDLTPDNYMNISNLSWDKIFNWYNNLIKEIKERKINLKKEILEGDFK